MTPAKSGSSATLVDAPVSVPTTANKLKIVFSGRPAPNPDGRNLWIDIDINLGKCTALFHSQAKESVGTHKKRAVTFRADQDCRLSFSDDRVFNRKSVNLTKHEQQTLNVDDTTSAVGANYEIEAKGVATTSAVAEESITAATLLLGGPHIVVP